MSFLSKLVNLIKVEFKFDLKQQLLDKIREPYNLKNIQNANNTWDFEDDVFKRVKNFTKGGDGLSDFEPIAKLTVAELIEVGIELGIPSEWVLKKPDDGLPCSMPDDDKFAKMGFSYALLDKYIRTGTSGNADSDMAIKTMHDRNAFKLEPVETINFFPF